MFKGEIIFVIKTKIFQMTFPSKTFFLNVQISNPKSGMKANAGAQRNNYFFINYSKSRYRNLSGFAP